MYLESITLLYHGKFQKNKRKERANQRATFDPSLIIVDFEYVSQFFAKTVTFVLIPQ